MHTVEGRREKAASVTAISYDEASKYWNWWLRNSGSNPNSFMSSGV